jgi:hypothetical protein
MVGFKRNSTGNACFFPEKKNKNRVTEVSESFLANFLKAIPGHMELRKFYDWCDLSGAN